MNILAILIIVFTLIPLCFVFLHLLGFMGKVIVDIHKNMFGLFKNMITDVIEWQKRL